MQETFLVLFWIVFFHDFFLSPYKYATSDHMSTYFALWRHGLKQDYYPSLKGIPFTCVWYLPHLLTSWVGRRLSLDHSFVLYMLHVVAHYLVASFAAYYLTGNLVCALGLAYAMRALGLNQSIAYSWCWMLACLACVSAGLSLGAGLCLWLAVAGGYWPIVLYSLPFVLLWPISPEFLVIPIFAIPPQLFFTISYIRGSVRTIGTGESLKQGSIPWWHYISLVYPLSLNMNGVLYPELSYGVGRAVLCMAVFSHNWLLWALCGLSVVLASGLIKVPLRGPGRATFMLSIGLCLMASEMVPNVHPGVYFMLLGLQCLDILVCHKRMILFQPFMQTASKPSEQFNTPLTRYLNPRIGKWRVSGLPHPLFTGYITGIRGLGYCGGTMDLETFKLRNIGNPNGCGYAHDWFSTMDDGPWVNDYGIKYAYKPAARLNPAKWAKTEIEGLYRNVLIDS